MMNKTAIFTSLGGALILLAATANPAAALKCQGGFAYNSSAGGLIANSICEDKLIAEVSGKPFNGKNGVRQNPKVKEEACRYAGSDIRIAHLCSGLRIEDQGDRIR